MRDTAIGQRRFPIVECARDASGVRAVSGRLLRLRLSRRRLARRLAEVGLMVRAGGENLAGAVEPALEAVAAAPAAFLPPGLKVGPEVTQAVDHGPLQLVDAVADDADVAATLDAPGREVVAQRLLVGAELHQGLVDLIDIALVLLARVPSGLQKGANGGLKRDLPLAVGAP